MKVKVTEEAYRDETGDIPPPDEEHSWRLVTAEITRKSGPNTYITCVWQQEVWKPCEVIASEFKAAEWKELFNDRVREGLDALREELEEIKRLVNG